MDGKRKEKKQRQQIYQREQSFTFKKKSNNDSLRKNRKYKRHVILYKYYVQLIIEIRCSEENE
jgi:hypothetical protein